MSWEDILRKDKTGHNTRQGSLPKELTEGAHIASRPIEEWFNEKQTESIPLDAKTLKPDSVQHKLLEEE